jgi:hypothetical protein
MGYVLTTRLDEYAYGSDAYFAAEDMFELHCYVCVAVLATCKE